MTATWLQTEKGDWLNADLAATAVRCPTITPGGPPRWQFFDAEGKGLGVVATVSISRLLGAKGPFA
jgi:hypothetical protein